jgi:hypothetical protein
MNRTLARFLQVLVLLVGLAALVFLLWEPHLEGRNAHATVWQVYFNDPFLAFAYLASIAFFAAVYQLFKILGYVGSHGAFSPAAPRAFRIIRNCALVLVGFVAIAEAIIFMQESDDRAGGVAMGLMIGLGSVAVAFIASKFERSLGRRLAPPSLG